MTGLQEILGRIVSFLIVLSIVVIIHEFGHFIVAKLFRIRVETFSMGFGKRLLGWTRGETDYRLSAIPLGGYVKLAGEQTEDATGKPDEFQSHPRWQRILVYVAGPTMNLFLAIVFFSFAFMIGVEAPAQLDEAPVVGYVEKGSPAEKTGIQLGDRILDIDSKAVATWNDAEIAISTNPGRTIPIRLERAGQNLSLDLVTESRSRYSLGYAGFTYAIPPVVDLVSSGLPAERAGLRKGDRILLVAGQPVSSFQQVSTLIRPNAGKELTFVIDRAGQRIELKMTPVPQEGVGKIGFSAMQRTTIKAYPFFGAIQHGVAQCGEMSTLVLKILKKYASRQMPLSGLSGPLDIAKYSYATAVSGLSTFLTFIAAISLQLGILNMLPIPVLDGGHVFLLLVESATRRDLSLRVKERILQVGFIFVIGLMVFVVVNDIVKVLPESIYKYVPWRN